MSRFFRNLAHCVCYVPMLTISLTELQQDQPQLYESLTKILNPEEQQQVQAVVHQAEANALAAAQAAAQLNGGAH